MNRVAVIETGSYTEDREIDIPGDGWPKYLHIKRKDGLVSVYKDDHHIDEDFDFKTGVATQRRKYEFKHVILVLEA